MPEYAGTGQVPDYQVSRVKGNKVVEPPKGPTLGRMLRMSGEELCKSLERAWVDVNKDGHRDRDVSRIAPGLYNARLRKSKDNGGTGNRHYDVWEFLKDDGNPHTTGDTPDAENSQLHIANHMTELKGCIALGTAWGEVDGDKDALQGSTSAYHKWHDDALALCTRLGRNPETEGIWILITDDM